MKTVTFSEILMDAAAMIRRGGLSQGARARTADGHEIGVYVKAPFKRYCLQGAVFMAFRRVSKRGAVSLDEGPNWQSAVENELAWRGLPRDIPEFNDAPGRTAEDVAELLETVAIPGQRLELTDNVEKLAVQSSVGLGSEAGVKRHYFATSR